MKPVVNYSIGLLSDVDNQTKSDFYGRAFPARAQMLTEHWRWWYRVGELGIEPLVVLTDNKIIGHAASIPVQLNRETKQELAAWLVDFAVLPEYQGIGVGKNLMRHWMELCPNQMTMGGTPQSLEVFKKCGWHETLRVLRCAAPIHPLKWVPLVKKLSNPQLSSVSSIWLKTLLREASLLGAHPVRDNFKRVCQLFGEIEKTKSGTYINRNESWVEWRLLNSPFVDEYFFYETNGAFSIIRKFRMGGLRRTHLLYLHGKSRPEEVALYRTVAKAAIQDGSDLVWMNTVDNELAVELKRIFPSQRSFGFWSKNADLRIQGFQAIDGDNDLFQIDDTHTL